MQIVLIYKALNWNTKRCSGLCKVQQLAKPGLFSGLLIPNPCSLCQLLITKLAPWRHPRGYSQGSKEKSMRVSLWPLYLLSLRMPHLSVIVAIVSLFVYVRCNDSLNACWQQFSNELLFFWCFLPLLSHHQQDAIICAKFI